MQTLDQYVGRIVRLDKEAFRHIVEHTKRREEALENCFIVAAVNRGTRKLVCYGSSLRIAVVPSEVVLV